MERGGHILGGLLLIALTVAGCVGTPADDALAAPAPVAASGRPAAVQGPAVVDQVLGTVDVPAAPRPVDAGPVKGDLGERARIGLAPSAEIVEGCPLETERSERAELHAFWVKFDGCVAATEPVMIGGLPDDPKADVEVHPGATSLRVQFHLDGAEAMTMVLRDPWGVIAARGSDEGDAERDTYFLAEVETPQPGLWKFRSQVEDVAVARAWTLVAVVTY